MVAPCSPSTNPSLHGAAQSPMSPSVPKSKLLEHPRSRLQAPSHQLSKHHPQACSASLGSSWTTSPGAGEGASHHLPCISERRNRKVDAEEHVPCRNL